MNQHSTLAERLLHLRTTNGYSARKVYSAIGMGQSTYSDLENGKTKTCRKIAELAVFYGCDPVWLATGQGSEEDAINSSDERSRVLRKLNQILNKLDDSGKIEEIAKFAEFIQKKND